MLVNNWCYFPKIQWQLRVIQIRNFLLPSQISAHAKESAILYCKNITGDLSRKKTSRIIYFSLSVTKALCSSRNNVWRSYDKKTKMFLMSWHQIKFPPNKRHSKPCREPPANFAWFFLWMDSYKKSSWYCWCNILSYWGSKQYLWKIMYVYVNSWSVFLLCHTIFHHWQGNYRSVHMHEEI